MKRRLFMLLFCCVLFDGAMLVAMKRKLTNPPKNAPKKKKRKIKLSEKDKAELCVDLAAGRFNLQDRFEQVKDKPELRLDMSGRFDMTQDELEKKISKFLDRNIVDLNISWCDVLIKKKIKTFFARENLKTFFANLKILHMNGYSRLTDDDVREIVACLPKLQKIYIEGCERVTRKIILELREKNILVSYYVSS